MAVLYINKVHGSPELDLKLEISGNFVTATLYSANNYGGNFAYPNGINYDISARGIGFSINTGSFSYSKSGQIIKTGSGTIGSGALEVRTTCQGKGSCFDSDHTNVPSYNSGKSSDVNTENLIVYPISPSYMSKVLDNTLILSYVMSTPPSNLNLSRTYLESPMFVSYTLGSGAFQKIIYGVKLSADSSTIFMSETTNLNINLTDHEILTAYNEFKSCGFNFPNSTAYMYIEIQTESGNISNNFSITIGGTSWIKNTNSWSRCVPYKPDVGKPCIMYTNIGGIWKRGQP
ncbi:MAG: hypothetical protein ACI4PR_01800 [Acutalibacteraceae bacterium]